MPTFLRPAFLFLAALTAIHPRAARAEETANSIKFSDPAQPGTLKVVLARGDVRIQGTDTAEVAVKTETKAATHRPRPDGLRVLTEISTFTLAEKNNVVTLDAASNGWAGSNANFGITVPRGTSVVVQNSFGGDIACSGVGGDIEVHSMNGQVRLDGVVGGVVVDTMNGEIRATIRELHDKKPLSFQSMNGEVVLRLPGDAKANVRLRTQNGAVLTDFDETALVTKTEATPRHAHGLLSPQTQQAIHEAAYASATAMKQVAQAMREQATAAAAAARSAVEAGDATAPTAPVPPAPPAPPMPPMPAIPTLSGGKLVTGTLNGGGPEISVATINGDVTLRKFDKK